jgi:hypothetical protein
MNEWYNVGNGRANEEPELHLRSAERVLVLHIHQWSIGRTGRSFGNKVLIARRFHRMRTRTQTSRRSSFLKESVLTKT